MTKDNPQYFHLHLISDATGETLTAMAKAVAVQFDNASPIEHVHPLVRTQKQLDRAIRELEAEPGIVLYTIVNQDLGKELQSKCQELNIPCVPVLDSIMQVFASYLGAPSKPTVSGQHSLDADYFRRIDALNYTLIHDDGQMPEGIADADIVLVGISRTSKTPTSFYLANRGFKTANIPIVLDIPLPENLLTNKENTFIVGIVASIERISHVRQHRLKELADHDLEEYIDPDLIKTEITYTKRLCAQNGWPVIDVTRRSIEETAAAILRLYHDRQAKHSAN